MINRAKGVAPGCMTCDSIEMDVFGTVTRDPEQHEALVRAAERVHDDERVRIGLAAGAPKTSKRSLRLIIGGAEINGLKPVPRMLPLVKGNRCARQAEPRKERNHASSGLELSDFDVVMRCARARCHEALLISVLRHRAHDPEAVICWAFSLRSLQTKDFNAITAFRESPKLRLSGDVQICNGPRHGFTSVFCGTIDSTIRRQAAIV